MPDEPDETVSALQEIASLLRRRIEQQEEIAQRSEERTAKRVPDIEKIQEDSKQRMAQIKVRFEQRDEQARLEKEQLQQEERHFKQQLLAELERHNAFLEQLLLRLTQ